MSPAEYESYLAAKLQNNTSLENDVPTKQTIGKSQLGLMCPQLPYAINHEAIPLLQGYSENGCPVDCGTDWSREKIVLLLERGLHRSANSKKAVRQLQQETEEKIRHN